jgi:porin
MNHSRFSNKDTMKILAHKYVKILVFFLGGLCGSAYSQEEPAHPRPYIIQGFYVGDLVNNLRGGIKTGSMFIGMADLTMAVDTRAAGLWHGGDAFIKAALTHGGLPSQAFIGDFQVMSNIAAGNHLYLQEGWLSQTYGTVAIIVGLQDLNAKFASNEYSGVYVNSTFGMHSTVASNVPASIFPLTSFAGTVIWSVCDQFSLLATVHDGKPIDFKDNPYNLKIHFASDHGLLAVAEAQIAVGEADHLHGVYKIGVYNHDHLAVFDPITNSTKTVYENNYGLYFTIDQSVLYKPGNKGSITVFARGSMSTKEYNDNFEFLGGGINYYGLVRNDGLDVSGLAFVHACLQTSAHETALEVTYQTPVMENITIQPDIQYILHPAGMGTFLTNSIVGTLRFGLHL